MKNEFNIEYTNKNNGKVETLIQVATHNVETHVNNLVKKGHTVLRVIEVAPMGDVTQGGMFGND